MKPKKLKNKKQLGMILKNLRVNFLKFYEDQLGTDHKYASK